MLPYLLILLVPSWFALSHGRRIIKSAWVFAFLTYFIFVAFRYEVGPDWWGYLIIHHASGYKTFWETLTGSEPLSYTLFWLSHHLNLHLYLSYVVAALIMLWGVFSFAYRTYNPWIAIVSATPYFIIVMGMSGIRQVMAAGVMLFLLARWKQLSQGIRGIYVLIAALFHTSALVNSILLVTQLHVRPYFKIVLGFAILGITYFVVSEVTIFAQRMELYHLRYIEDPEKIESLGAIFHVGLILIPGFAALLFRRRMLPYVHDTKLLDFSIIASFVVLVLNFIPFLSNTLASRLTIYMYFIPMIVYPALTMALGKSSRQILTLMIILFHFAILIIWMKFANHSHAFIPYKSLLFNFGKL